MKTITSTLFIFFAIFFATITGCKKNGEDLLTRDDFPTDVAYFKYLSQNDDTYSDFDELGGDDVAETFGKQSLSENLADKNPIRPLRFAKKITSFTKDFSVDSINDSTRILHIKKTLTGNLVIVGLRNDTDTVRIEKPFTQNAQRNMEFHRVKKTGMMNERWRPFSITVGEGKTGMAQDSFSIVAVALHNLTTGDSVHITSPLDTWFEFGDLFHGHKHDSVTVRITIESTSPDTEIVVTRVGRGRRVNYHKRLSIPCIAQVQNGNTYTRTYERTFDIHHGIGRFNGVFEVISHNTLFDDDAAKMTSTFWSVPYRVALH